MWVWPSCGVSPSMGLFPDGFSLMSGFSSNVVLVNMSGFSSTEVLVNMSGLSEYEWVSF